MHELAVLHVAAGV
jgi:hypothetical protein